jgi:hypothetical protein
MGRILILFLTGIVRKLKVLLALVWAGQYCTVLLRNFATRGGRIALRYIPPLPMAYVPGFEHDIFISYAHGDDRDWINRLLDRLKPELKRRLGIEPTIWIDKDDLRSSRDFRKEIPESVRSSAVFVLLPSPTYIRSPYCVGEECRAYGETIPLKRKRFGGDFANEQFVLRCPLLPVDDNEHRQLFPGLTDIDFCSDMGSFPIGTPEFETSFRKLTGELMQLLKRMRNRSTPVFVYPPNPSRGLREAYEVLSKELSAGSYRLLPDRLVSFDDQLREASLSVFLMGDFYDEIANQLIKAARVSQKPWVVWCSPASQNVPPGQEQQLGLLKDLEDMGPAAMTFLNAAITPSKLKEEVLALLRPDAAAAEPEPGKPSIYLIFNPKDQNDRINAGLIKLHYQEQFHFDIPDDPAQRTVRLMSSNGVMLIWGKSDEKWCSGEFESIMQVSRREQSKGLCLFDPKESKMSVADLIRQKVTDLYVAEEYGRFEPARLEAFFNPILRSSAGAP